MPGKKKGKKPRRKNTQPQFRPLEYKKDMQEYAKIVKLLGDCRVTVMLPEKSEIMGLIPGKFKRRVRMKVGDIVLVQYREYQENRVDIIYKYQEEEARRLQRENEIPIFFIKDEDNDVNEENTVIFQEESDSEEIDLETL